MKRYRYITTKLLLLLMLLMTGAGEVWAVDDTFTVKSGTTTTLGETIYTGTYTSLTLGVSPDALSNTFAVSAEDDAYQICGTQAPKYGEGSVGTGQVPDRGSFFKIVTSKPGEFVFRIKLNKTKRVHFRKSDGTEINTKENDDLECKDINCHEDEDDLDELGNFDFDFINDKKRERLMSLEGKDLHDFLFKPNGNGENNIVKACLHFNEDNEDIEEDIELNLPHNKSSKL